ncbi:MAG: SWIM zinc finger family protein [Anaerolineales bacterium]|nr:SWIM zinc finger family protein [Anaerolineales bacterium]
MLAINRRGNLITGEVQGSEFEPYTVTVTLDEDDAILSAGCTCPVGAGGYCKHIVAVLLSVLKTPAAVAVRADLATLLAGLTEAQLRQLLVTVGAEQADFADAIERAVQVLRRVLPTASAAGTVLAAPAPVDLVAIRRDLRRDFRKAASTRGGGYGGRFYDEYDELAIDAGAIVDSALTMAEALLAAGDATGATTLLTNVIEEWSECLTDLEE